MNVFTQLGKIRAFEKKHLPFLMTIEDFDIVCVIGLHQELGKPLLLKNLYLEGIGSIATVTRRLTKLRVEGVLVARTNAADQRVIALMLSPAVQKVYLRYGDLLAGLPYLGATD